VKLLIAEDDHLFRTLLRRLLANEYELEIVEDGDSAWSVLQQENAPQLAILDWVMPGLTGPQVCRNVRSVPLTPPPYLLLFTAKSDAADIVSGLRAGADDYITKPFNPEELRARVQVGRRVVELQTALDAQIAATRAALATQELLRQAESPCTRCHMPQTETGFVERVKML
jgi:DNA-binding response OmpR family regulator